MHPRVTRRRDRQGLRRRLAWPSLLLVAALLLGEVHEPHEPRIGLHLLPLGGQVLRLRRELLADRLGVGPDALARRLLLGLDGSIDRPLRQAGRSRPAAMDMALSSAILGASSAACFSALPFSSCAVAPAATTPGIICWTYGCSSVAICSQLILSSPGLAPGGSLARAVGVHSAAASDAANASTFDTVDIRSPPSGSLQPRVMWTLPEAVGEVTTASKTPSTASTGVGPPGGAGHQSASSPACMVLVPFGHVTV